LSAGGSSTRATPVSSDSATIGAVVSRQRVLGDGESSASSGAWM
jgi:hypothetical protein